MCLIGVSPVRWLGVTIGVRVRGRCLTGQTPVGELGVTISVMVRCLTGQRVRGSFQLIVSARRTGETLVRTRLLTREGKVVPYVVPSVRHAPDHHRR